MHVFLHIPVYVCMHMLDTHYIPFKFLSDHHTGSSCLLLHWHWLLLRTAEHAGDCLLLLLYYLSRLQVPRLIWLSTPLQNSSLSATLLTLSQWTNRKCPPTCAWTYRGSSSYSHSYIPLWGQCQPLWKTLALNLMFWVSASLHSKCFELWYPTVRYTLTNDKLQALRCL